MEFKNFLKNHFDQLTEKDVDQTDDIGYYDKFRKFITSHYSFDHLQTFNYIKYVKVKRQILKMENDTKYMKYINGIDSIIRIMNQNNVFPNIKIKNYMYKTNVVFNIIIEREKILVESIRHIRSLLELKKGDNVFNMKIICSINTISRRYRIFLKYSKILKVMVNKLIKLEETYDIDHKLIELNNMYRSFLGKKSEYTASKIIVQYINDKNSKNSKIKYFYETNINLFKLLNIKNDNTFPIKGEVDGLIISYDGTTYFIETIIEVKSSVKSTFDDTIKFVSLQNFIKNMKISQKIQYENYVFTDESFSKIRNENMSEWVIYICINNVKYDIIEKSHFYFSNVLKIIDDDFIKSFYIDKNDKSIRDKHNIILQNTNYVNELFSAWKDHINLGKESCNMFMTKN
jgi:hypothetical protein